MIRSVVGRALLALFALTVGGAGTSRAAVQNRIGSVQGSARAAVAHTVHPRALAATDLGEAPSSGALENMSLNFQMTAAQQASLDQLLLDQQNPASPLYRQWLTPEQFGAKFGMSAADLSAVSAWLSAQGLTVTGVARSSTFITFKGTVGQVEQAFQTSIHRVSANGEEHIANLTDPLLPAALAATVGSISGLNDFRLKPHAQAKLRTMEKLDGATVHPKDSVTTSSGLEHFLSPGDFYKIYNETPLLNNSINGSGIKIAVMGQVGVTNYLSDFAAFRTAAGLSANAPTIQTYGTNPPGAPTSACLGSSPPSSCSPSIDDLYESELDIEWAGAAAQSAQIIFVNSTDVLLVSMVQAIANNLAPIMTVSYGECEKGYTVSDRTTLNSAFAQANAQGITVFGPTGDSGAADCETSGATTAVNGLAVDFPASSPYVTAVGGNEFNEGADTTTPSGTYWNNTGSSTTSALSYIPEKVWNDSSSSSLAGGGGGVSVYYTKPTWQRGTGVPSDSMRDIPDVSLSASANHDAYLVCAIGSCTSGNFYNSSGSFYAFGGTSVSTPSFSGILALTEQQLGGTRVGNLNPSIYSLANGSHYSAIFHDVTTGNNNSPCTAGSTGCASGGSIGYSAGVGYDQATGWGSVDVNQFATNFSTAAVGTSSSTTLATSAASVVTGTNVTFTATVAPASGTGVPTGTVVFAINGTTASTVTLSSTGTAAYTTSFSAGGSDVVTATYSGDNAFYSSTATVTETVTLPPGAVATTTTLASSASTVAIGGSLTLTATVTSTYAGTISGNVAFTTGSTPLGTAAVGSTGIATLTLSALTASALPVGTDSIVAAFGGGGNDTANGAPYAASTSPAVSVIVTNPTISLTATNISVSSGGSGSSTITVTSGGGFSGGVALTASSTSTLSGSYVFSPSTVTLTSGGSATSTFTITSATGSLKGGVNRLSAGGIGGRPSTPWLVGGGAVMAGLLCLLPLAGRRRLPTLLGLSVFALLLGGVGCSSSSATTTKTGTYTVTVTGTASSNAALVGTTTFTITIQ